MALKMIVVRKAPPGAESLEGRWYQVNFEEQKPTVATLFYGITFAPTGRFEAREDGAQAEAYEPKEPRP